MSLRTGPLARILVRSSFPALAALVLFGSACSSGGGGEGTLKLEWTVNGTSDTALCDANVGWVVVRITDYAGNHWTNGNAPCHTLGMSFESVPSGTFGVSAYMFNAGTNATLSEVSSHSVSVNASATTTDTLAFTVPAAN